MANLAGENRKSGESPAVSSASASRREEKGNLKLGERRSLLIFIGLFFCLHAPSPIREKSPKRGSIRAHLCFPETAQKGKKKNPLNPNNVRTTDADIHQATKKLFFLPRNQFAKKKKDFFRRVTLVCCVVVAEIASKVFPEDHQSPFVGEKSRNKHLFYPQKLPRYF